MPDCASSVTMVMCWAQLKMNQFGAFKKYLAITVILALAFMGFTGIGGNIQKSMAPTPMESTDPGEVAATEEGQR